MAIHHLRPDTPLSNRRIIAFCHGGHIFPTPLLPKVMIPDPSAKHLARLCHVQPRPHAVRISRTVTPTPTLSCQSPRLTVGHVRVRQEPLRIATSRFAYLLDGKVAPSIQ